MEVRDKKTQIKERRSQRKKMIKCRRLRKCAYAITGRKKIQNKNFRRKKMKGNRL
jgi:hypothetical protein